MTAVRTCRDGHRSLDEEFCEVGGIAIDPPLPSDNGTATTPTTTTNTAASCPSCGSRLYGRFCEECGHDCAPDAPLPTPRTEEPPAEPLTELSREWTATVAVSQRRYAALAAAGRDRDLGDPAGIDRERTFLLRGEQVTIGRHSASRQITPDIDLAEPPEDAAVSHLHAVLIPQHDGGWAIVDVGSTNGTTVNDEEYPLRVNVPRRLADGDTVLVGAWTAITIAARDAA